MILKQFIFGKLKKHADVFATRGKEDPGMVRVSRELGI